MGVWRVVLVVALILATSVVGPLGSPEPAAAGPRPVVYLTFDDGPGPYTPGFLDLLAAYHIRGTFFVTGANTAANGELAQRIVAEGHAIANHSYSHPVLTSLPDAAVAAELAATSQVVAATTGITPTCYRPPYGAVNARVHAVAVSVGLPNVAWLSGSNASHWGLWDIDTNDWRLAVGGSAWTEADMRRQLDRAGDGDVILMHDGGVSRGRGLTVLAQWLAANHDRFEFRPLPGCGGGVHEPGWDPAHPERWHRFQIARLYRAYFDRAPDPEGWDYWTEVYARGASLTDISHWFALSSEFALQGERNDAEFVAFVYREVLDREPESGGFAYWQGQMAAGLDRGALVTFFSESDEYVSATAPVLTGDCWDGDVASSYRCWAERLSPPRVW
jgi:peptidoglycan/xylan/chitin deacetylase (PgdA/CDA1 family)